MINPVSDIKAMPKKKVKSKVATSRLPYLLILKAVSTATCLLIFQATCEVAASRPNSIDNGKEDDNVNVNKMDIVTPAGVMTPASTTTRTTSGSSDSCTGSCTGAPGSGTIHEGDRETKHAYQVRGHHDEHGNGEVLVHHGEEGNGEVFVHQDEEVGLHDHHDHIRGHHHHPNQMSDGRRRLDDDSEIGEGIATLYYRRFDGAACTTLQTIPGRGPYRYTAEQGPPDSLTEDDCTKICSDLGKDCLGFEASLRRVPTNATTSLWATAGGNGLDVDNTDATEEFVDQIRCKVRPFFF